MTEDNTASQEQIDDKKNANRTKKQYVLPHERGWQVKLEGSNKATKVFKTKLEAEAYAKQLAKNQSTKVVRQKKDGTFQKKR